MFFVFLLLIVDVLRFEGPGFLRNFIEIHEAIGDKEITGQQAVIVTIFEHYCLLK